jgi:hypothetical protein
MSGISDIALIRGEPIERYGLKFYPITMEHYEEWNACKGVLTLRMSTLPALYGAMPYLEALFAMDMDAMEKCENSAGMLSRFFTLMCLSMRIPPENITQYFQFAVRSNGEKELVTVRVTVGEIQTTITPSQFNVVRQTIADLNGIELPDESENAELVQAENDLRNKQAENLNYSLRGMIAAVARDNHVAMKDVLDWTILEFDARREAGTRDRYFAFSRNMSAYGGKWKGDDPYPSWIFNRAHESTALIEESAWKQQLGSAVNQTDALPEQNGLNILKE